MALQRNSLWTGNTTMRENKGTVKIPTSRTVQVAKVKVKLVDSKRRWLVVLAKADDKPQPEWGLTQVESRQILQYAADHLQVIVFYDVTANGAAALRGWLTHVEWAKMEPTQRTWPKSGEFRIDYDDIRHDKLNVIARLVNWKRP